MKVEIINKPMLCWDYNESNSELYHVLAKITNSTTRYPFKAVTLEGEGSRLFKYAKPIPDEETVEMTIAEVSNLVGKTVKIVE